MTDLRALLSPIPKAVALRPRCACGSYLQLRNPYGGSTPEQNFCGVWYDHPDEHSRTSLTHTKSVLYPSQALLNQAAE